MRDVITAEEITIDNYAEGVIQLEWLARQRSSGAKVAAQVLLSAYNGGAYQLDISDLCLLDGDNYAAAIVVLRGRYEVGCEPHQVIENGSEIFRALWDRWDCLHISERSKKTCPRCYGEGEIRYAGGRTETCPACLGEGRVCACRA